MATAIEFNHVSKMYRLGLVGTGTISDDLKRWWAMSVLGKEDPFLKVGQTNDRASKAKSDFVYALKDIDFKVEQGDVVGIIGKNGAGKSTLLKLLSRITAPTTGTIKAKGRIASLLEVGTGFHGELTGRENIYMNGSIMGMRKHEIDRKLDEIVDFSGCEMYIDTPVKRYSSGMSVRLGFAVAAFLEPEILVVDEVLAVGDAEFQKKAIGKMQDVSQGEGRTVLFVSHNMASVRQLCRNGIVLKNGMVEMMGSATECVDFYISNNVSELISSAIIEKKHRPWSDSIQELEITEVRILNQVESIASDEDLNFEIVINRKQKNISECQISISFDDESDTKIMTYITSMIKIPIDVDTFVAKACVRKHDLTKGRYFVNFNLGIKDFSKGIRNYDAVSHALSFEVTRISGQKHYVVWSKGWGAILHNGDLINLNISK